MKKSVNRSKFNSKKKAISRFENYSISFFPFSKRSISRFDSELIKFIPESKRSQQILGMSFGVIFSIILIVFFIIIAIIVINSFLKAGDCAKIGLFVDKFKADIKSTWNSQEDKHVFTTSIPGKIEYVCIADLVKPIKGSYSDIGNEISIFEWKEANLFFYPSANSCEIPYHNIPHLDVDAITNNMNPYCIAVDDGKIRITIEKDLSDALVFVKA